MFAFQNIELPEKELKDITRYEKSYGEDWVNSAIIQHQIRSYMKEHLELLEIESKLATPYNCYNTGHEVWKRKDNTSITQDDWDALDNCSNGQGNKMIGKVGDMKVVREWFCDSGD